MDRERLLREFLQKKIEWENRRYDEGEAMLYVEQKKWAGGYHTRKTGTCILFGMQRSMRKGFSVGKGQICIRGQKMSYERSAALQDCRESSATYGLWAYYLEEDLGQMIAPDYNWADFISKSLIGIRILDGEKLTQETKEIMDQAIRRAALCSIKRNVGLDYTNIALMSTMTILSAGELLDEEEIKNAGMERLRKFYAYTKFNGAFSEYNSSAYLLVALHEISRMKQFFQNPEAKEKADYFNQCAWETMASHYNAWIRQLTPPQARAYVNLDQGNLAWVVYLGTDGAYGAMPRTDETGVPLGITMDSLLYPSVCPEEYRSRFSQEERFLEHTYYKKNNLREEGTDTTIIRDLNHPDLTAYSYQTKEYSMGIFKTSDCWNQRRNAMVVWGKEMPSYVRLRGMIGEYDFCSAMVYGIQHRNRIFGHLGFVSDRGSFHYILDKRKDGVYETDRIYFQFETGDRTDLCFTYVEGGYEIKDQGLVIRIEVPQFVFDGKPGIIRLSEDRRKLLLIGYEGEKKEIDTRLLGDSYGIFSMEVRRDGEEKGQDFSVETRLEQGVLSSRGVCEGRSWKLESSVRTIPFLEASRICAEGRQTVMIEKIMDKMQHMENESDVEETCPISIISMDAWEWPQGVALFAMYQYYENTKDEAVLDFLESWFDRQIEKGLPSQNVNTTCPMLTLAYLYEKRKKETWKPLLLTWAEGAFRTMTRTGEGAIQHVVSGVENKGQIWDDTLYMTVLFLAKMGDVFGKEEYIEESIRQFLVHIKYLVDRKTGLLYHGWTFLEKHHFGEALWGRGNSWYTAGLVDYLEILKGSEGVRAFLLTTLEEQVKALEQYQDESGLWHTLLDDPDSYLETSATCAFAYGILKAVRMGYIDKRYEKVGIRAVDGVLGQIAWDGTVHGVSYGTPVFATKQEYKEVPICPMPYGQSMALMMLVEAEKHRRI